MTGKIEFTGQLSGDGECFRWSDVPEADVRRIQGEKSFNMDVECDLDFASEMKRPLTEKEAIENNLHLYPGDILHALGCERDKRYKFTVIVEEVTNL